jgi:hypothetical protein
MPSPYPSARVAVQPETWRAFRQAALVRGIHISDYLAKLVGAELTRRATLAGEVSLTSSETEQGLAALRAVRAAIDELDDIAGRLARAPTNKTGLGATSHQAFAYLRTPHGRRTTLSSRERHVQTVLALELP